jgi:hypothetical protein
MEESDAEKNESSKNDAIRTFQSDIAGRVKNDNVSMIKMALAEKMRQERNPGQNSYADVTRPRPGRGLLIAVIVIMFLITGGVIGMRWYFNRPIQPTISEIIAPDEPEILYSEAEAAVSSDNKSSDQIFRDLRTEIMADLDLGVIKRTLLTKGMGSSTKNTSASEFLDLLHTRVNDSLKAAFSGQYLLGSYSKDPHETFLLFKVDSYESAYAGMLAWEPFMEGDIGKLFPSSLIIATTTTSAVETGGQQSAQAMTPASSSTVQTAVTASTSPISPALATSSAAQRTVNQPVATFKDRIVQNKDARVLIDTDESIKFMYVFLDAKTLLIVSSERGLKEVLARMTTGRIRR